MNRCCFCVVCNVVSVFNIRICDAKLKPALVRSRDAVGVVYHVCFLKDVFMNDTQFTSIRPSCTNPRALYFLGVPVHPYSQFNLETLFQSFKLA